ncbi:protein PFC0760c-like, partial [Contarinia nasturtii]|uniref:protein PFC0760c-like n=1 Tax=Contarinia nasturtii TaxID=265458 RepID=UPI0012D48095
MEPDNQDKTPNMSQPHQGAEIVRDKYCWECNRFIPEVIRKNNCWKCFRSFHGKCLAGYGQLSSRIDPAEWECPICIKLESSKTDFVGKQSVLDLLKYTMNDILKNCAFQELQTYLTNCGNNCDDIVNPIDLNQMKKKTDDRLYDSLEAFIVDAKYIDHNIYLTDRQSSYMRKLCVDNLVQFCEAQIENIKSCAECYENRHKYPEEWRFMACSKPNIVLWTKNFGDRKYWPVKLISIVNDIQIKVVRFDGHSSDFINILPKNCYLFSKDSPAYGKYNLESELKEAKSYIINAAKKFGTFHLAPNRTRFKANQLVTYVKAMYPNYNGPCPYSLEKNGEEMDNGDDNHDVFNSIEDDSDDTEYSEENSGSFSEDSTDDSEIDDPNENESDNGTTTPNRKRCVSSEDINVHINTTSNNNSQEFIEHAETDMDTGIPTKKPRISSENEIKNDTVIQDNHQCDTSIVNVSGLADSTSPSGCNSSATVQDLVQSISQIVQTEAINFEKTNQVKFEAVQNELTVSKEKNAKYERVIKDLNDKLQVVTSERDQNEAKALQEKQIFAKLKLRFEIERQKAKEESAKSQEKLEELSTRIQTIKNEKALENSE